MLIRSFLIVFVFLLVQCRPLPDTIALPTAICVRVQHHHQPIPDARVFIKYNQDTFPGYDKPPEYFDAVRIADQEARVCFESVPEGRHWIVGFGYDSLYFPHDVYGSMVFDIDLNTRPKVDTVFYISE